MSEPPSTAAVLAERARSAEFEPWLFHRDGWDWCWRSWGQVADHVARCVEVLRDVETSASESLRAGFADRQHPDAVTIGLALQAAGWVAVPVRGGREEAEQPGCDVWVEVGDASPAPGETSDLVVLPHALSPLDRTPLQPLVIDRAPGVIRLPRAGELDSASCIDAAERLSVGRDRNASGRAIVCAAPDLGPYATRLLEAWTVVHGAAWVLEPQASAFVETVLWARPTVVWGRARELEPLAARLRVRKHRRRCRLTSVVAAGKETVDSSPWEELGIECIALDGGLGLDA